MREMSVSIHSLFHRQYGSLNFCNIYPKCILQDRHKQHSMRKIRILALLLLVLCLCTTPASAETFTDDLGRTVSLPSSVDKVIPSGDLSLSVLLSFDPEYLASCGNGLPSNAETYLPALSAKHLPVTGNILSSATNINYEEIMNLAEQGADLYIDAGQKKAGIGEVLDKLTSVTGMPSVFVSQNSLDSIPQSYKTLGTLLGEEKRDSVSNLL